MQIINIISANQDVLIHEFWAKSNLTWVTMESFSFYQGKQSTETGSELKALGIN